MRNRLYILTALLPVLLLSHVLSSGSNTSAAPAALRVIKPGEVWPDDRGQHIQAHGGGIIKHGSTYYWFGEDRSPDNDSNKRYVACYSSKDLVNWKFRRQVLKLADPENF